MDKLEQRLREDAALIRAEVSAELDERIIASLEAAAAERPAARERRRAAGSFWWASSLTGLAAAFGLIALLNLWPADTVENGVRPTVAGPVGDAPVMPLLRVETAVLTAPLEQELDNLEADLEKARKAVSEDLGL
jgi:hypothetical protein